jgi:ABC-type branched-subunit amino acid transport system substrate-binding protein
MFFGIKDAGWSPSVLTNLLKEVTVVREKEGYQKPHNVIIHPRPGSEFVILGPLYGSFHSLVRILTELSARGIIDNTYKIIKPDTYIVSLGNVVDHSPLNMETLSLLLALMKANPTTMIYLAGLQETDNAWLGYGLKREISQRIGSLNIDASISQLFSTLPRALFIHGTEQVIRISDSPYSPALRCAYIPVGTVRICPATAQDKQVAINASITGEHRLMSYQQNYGLVQAPSKEGVLTWALFSAPNYWYRHFFSFNYDAFTVLRIRDPFAGSDLTLYAQHADELDGFPIRARYEVLTGKNLLTPTLTLPVHENPFIPSAKVQQELAECKSTQQAGQAEKQPLYIGCTLDLSKGGSPIGKAVRDGIALRMDRVNARGGINGQIINVIFMDDEYSPEKARQNVEEFIKKYSSNLFICNLGSPTLETYVDLVKEEKIFIFFPITGAPIFRQPDVKGIVHWRASYKTEAQVLTQYMIDILKVRNFAFLYQSDSYGQGALEGANQVIKKEAIKQVVNVGYERNTTSFVPQIKTIKEASVTGLGFFSTSLAATEFIRQAGIEFFIGKKLFALSDLADESFKKFAAQRGLDFIIAQFAPNPKTSIIPIVREFRRVLSESSLSVADVFTLEGYIAASLMLHILQKAEGTLIEDITKVIGEIHDEEFKGLPLDYDSETHELVHLLWIDTGLPTWIKQNLRKGS